MLLTLKNSLAELVRNRENIEKQKTFCKQSPQQAVPFFFYLRGGVKSCRISGVRSLCLFLLNCKTRC